jgi:pimeloyl-ACP methyl ester carboxylesterase
MRVAVNGVRLYFDVEGAELVPDGPVMRKRPTVLLLHGGPGADHATYKPFMSPLAEHAQLIYLDHRGQGRSDESVPDAWTLAQWADDVAGFMDALEIEKPYILGASYGGFVAQAFATAYPDRLSKLALVSTAARTDADLSAEMFGALGGPQVGEVARRHLNGATLETEAAFFAHCLPHYTVGDFDMEALGRSIDRSEVRRMFFGDGGEWQSMDYRAALSHIKCPTLVLHGDLDPILPLPLAREMVAAIPGGLARMHVVKDAGHGWLDHSEEWLDVLTRFLFES